MPNFGDNFGGGNVKLIQRGVIALSISVNTQSVAITPVNPAFSELRMLGITRSAPSNEADIAPATGYITLTGGGASVTATSAFTNLFGSAERYVSWELTEYYPS